MRQKTDENQCVDIVGISSIARAKDFNHLEFDINFSSKVIPREIQTYLQTLKTCLQPLSVCLFSGSSPIAWAAEVNWKYYQIKTNQKDFRVCKFLLRICYSIAMAKTHSLLRIPGLISHQLYVLWKGRLISHQLYVLWKDL